MKFQGRWSSGCLVFGFHYFALQGTGLHFHSWQAMRRQKQREPWTEWFRPYLRPTKKWSSPTGYRTSPFQPQTGQISRSLMIDGAVQLESLLHKLGHALVYIASIISFYNVFYLVIAYIRNYGVKGSLYEENCILGTFVCGNFSCSVILGRFICRMCSYGGCFFSHCFRFYWF